MPIDRTLLTACLLLLGPIAHSREASAPTVTNQPEAVLEELDEVLVTGEQPGPALWQVKSGGHTLWILAEVRMLSNKMKWRSKQVENVLANTQEVLAVHGSAKLSTAADKATAKKNVEMWERMRYLPGDKTLRDILPPETYTRLESTKATVSSRGKDLERLTPAIAANRLWNDSFRALDLGLTPIAEKVVEMAKRRKVKITQVAPLFLNGNPRPPPTEESFMNPCALEPILSELDDGGARIKARANAWAVGDVERLKQLIMNPTPLRSPQCAVPAGSAPTPESWIGGIYENTAREKGEDSRFSQIWFAAAERSLAQNSSTLAVVDAVLLLSPGGLLDKLKGRGYEVVEP